jgi:uncharacterized zinc-type alcohol dehydrogenase-like protein
MLICTGFGAQSPTTPLAPITFNRRIVAADDVQIAIAFRGVWHGASSAVG